MNSVNINEVTVSLVAPRCDKTILQKEGIKYDETWLVAKGKSSIKTEEPQKMLQFLAYSLRKLISFINPQDSPASILMLHHIVVGEVVTQDNQDVLFDIFAVRLPDIVYFACNMERPISSHKDTAKKFSELLDLSTVITDATCFDLENKTIQLGHTCFECITVGYNSTPSKSTPWGGLVDMVIPKNVKVRGEDGRGNIIECDSCPAVYAVATVISALHRAHSLGVTPTDIMELRKSRTMRRVLISMCYSADPSKHDPLEGFGALQPERLLEDSHDLKEIIKSNISYWRNRQMPRERQHCKVDYTAEYTETNKTTLVRQLTSHQVDPAHKVVVGIMGSGLNPIHPLLAGRQLDLSSVSVCEDEKDQTNDWYNHTTSFTACLVNLLCTADGDSLLNRVRLIHIKDITWNGKGTDDDYSKALEQFLHQGVHVVLHPFIRLHPVATWSGVKLVQRLRDTAVFITTAHYEETYPYDTFPQTEVLAVGGMTSDGRLSPKAAAGPRVDFVAPLEHQTIGHRRPLPGIYTRNATSFTGAVTVYILVLASVHGVDESRIRRLSTTSVMRAILIEMCSHPERRTASMGYGVLDPWPYLNDWTKLGPIVMKNTDPDAEQTLWAGKDI